MRKFVLVCCFLCFPLLCSCQGTNNEQKEQQSISCIEAESFSQSDIDEKLLHEKYVDISTLPVLDFDFEYKTMCDDRTLEVEDSIDNQLEMAVYEIYYNALLGDYDKIMDVIGENEALEIAFENEKEDFYDGNYMEKYILHEINILTDDDINGLNEFSKKSLYELINEYSIEKYAVAELDLTFNHNEKSLSMGPQLGDGRYKRYYVFGRTHEGDEYKLYEIYWDDFMS